MKDNKASKFCPQCGSKLTKNSRFCSKCGTALFESTHSDDKKTMLQEAVKSTPSNDTKPAPIEIRYNFDGSFSGIDITLKKREMEFVETKFFGLLGTEIKTIPYSQISAVYAKSNLNVGLLQIIYFLVLVALYSLVLYKPQDPLILLYIVISIPVLYQLASSLYPKMIQVHSSGGQLIAVPDAGEYAIDFQAQLRDRLHEAEL